MIITLGRHILDLIQIIEENSQQDPDLGRLVGSTSSNMLFVS